MFNALLWIALQALRLSVCVCSSAAWQGMPGKQLKLFINALLDNTPANPIIWQAAIRAFASLAACLSLYWQQICYQCLVVKMNRGINNILTQASSGCLTYVEKVLGNVP